ncbi:hypothetical protein YK56LOC_36880 [Caballeronia sp. HLA56]
MQTSDDFFALMTRMLNPETVVFICGKYDDNGKWIDSWESRRKRVSGWFRQQTTRPLLNPMPGMAHGKDQCSFRHSSRNRPLELSM